MSWYRLILFLCIVAMWRQVVSQKSKPGSDAPFDVCKPFNAVDAAARARMVAMAGKVISSCGYKIISENKITWGKEMIKAIPKLLRLSCYYLTVAYNYFAIAPNLISEETRHNSTQLHDVLLAFKGAIAVESRVNKFLCYNIDGKRACYEKKDVVDLFEVWIHCYWVMSHGIVPATVEEFLGLYLIGVKKFVSKGLIKFYIG